MFRRSFLFFRVQRARLSTAVEKANEAVSEACHPPTRLLNVAIIGTPNAGKSTIINHMMNRRVCATSCRAHTTRVKSKAVLTTEDTQVVFLDTPGLVHFKEVRRFNLERSFLKDSKACLEKADLIGVVHDVSSIHANRLDIKVIKLLEEFEEVPSILIFNKVDLLKSKRKLLELTRLITENSIDGVPKGDFAVDFEARGWPNFKEVYMVSALTGCGLAEVKNYFIRNAKPAYWKFPEQVWSDQSAEELILKSTKAKLLDFLPQEIPYQLRPEMEYFNMSNEGVITAVVLVHCPTERIAKLVAGVSDGKLKQINQSLQNDLQNTFQTFVRIKVVLKHPQNK